MRYLFSFIIVLFSSLKMTAQTVDEQVNSKIENLRKQGIDTMVVYSESPVSYDVINIVQYIIGDSIIYEEEDDCYANQIEYLWWKSKAGSFVLPFDDCNIYPELKADTMKFFDFYMKNKEKINSEEIKRNFCVDSINRSTSDKKIEGSSIMVSESDYYSFNFVLGANNIKKNADGLDLRIKELHGKPNINWEYNQSTKLKKLIDIAEEETSKIRTWTENYKNKSDSISQLIDKAKDYFLIEGYFDSSLVALDKALQINSNCAVVYLIRANMNLWWMKMGSQWEDHEIYLNAALTDVDKYLSLYNTNENQLFVLNNPEIKNDVDAIIGYKKPEEQCAKHLAFPEVLFGLNAYINNKADYCDYWKEYPLLYDKYCSK